MRRVFGVIVLMLLLAVAVPAPADGRRAPKKARTEQKKSTSRRSSGDVRKERRRTAGEIEKTQQQINSNTRETRRQLNRLASLDAEISRNEASIAGMQQRVDTLEESMKLLSDSIGRTAAEVSGMRAAYGRSLRAMRTRRTQLSAVAFVLGARSVSEAWRRARYLRELSAAHADKAARLRAASDSLAARRARLDRMHGHVTTELGRMAAARTMLREKQLRADTLVASLKREGASLKRVLAEKRRQAAELDRELDRIIAEEQRRAEEAERAKAAAEAKARAEAEAKAKAKTNAAASSGGKAAAAATPAAKPAEKAKPLPPPEPVQSAAESRTLSGGFLANKGRLLFPVAGNYRIVSTFGRTDHPRIPGVKIQNSGIDIEAVGGSPYARAVYDGTVTSVFRIDGYQNVVILRHGEYLTVYAGLDNIAVRKGDKVKTGQRLGHIYSDADDGERPMLHFELRREKQKLNPSEWVKP